MKRKEAKNVQKITVEVCCGSAEDVAEAARGGADRAELNSDLFHGGLTPSAGELTTAKRAADLPILVMIRPREGGFCYTETEFQTALADAEILLRYGADGIVFGFLKEDGTVDTERCRQMMRVAGNREAVFHRAFDVVPDWRAALDQLCEIGIRRILTSGQAPSAPEGAETIAEMRRYARGRIQILPGAGITARNIRRVLAETGCPQAHISPKRTAYDRSADGNPEIFFGGTVRPPEDRYRRIDGDAVRTAVERLNGESGAGTL